MLGTAVLTGNDLGYTSDAPVDADYLITGYINQGGKVLHTGTKLPMDSPLRASSELLMMEIRVGRLKLMPAKAIASGVAEPENPKTTSKSKTKGK